MLKKKINFKKVRTVLIRGSEKRLKEESLNIIDGIKERTESGKNVKGKTFKKYSTKGKYSYADKRKDAGKRVTPPNLAWTGHMLEAISAKPIKGGLRFYFNAKAETDKASWNQKTRKFFGISKNQIKYLKKVMGKL